MKVIDYMIGAYVQNPLGAKGWVKNIRFIEKDHTKFDGYYLIDIAYSKDGQSYATLELDDIYPIPLTEEFLKKNGFKYFHKNYASLSYNHHLKLEMKEWPDENGLGGVWVTCDNIEIRFVHQLQLLLALSGIDKELVL